MHAASGRLGVENLVLDAAATALGAESFIMLSSPRAAATTNFVEGSLTRLLGGWQKNF